MHLRYVNVLMLLAAAGMVGCERQGSAQSMQPPPATVTVSVPISREVMEWDEYPGWLDAVHVVEARAQVSGYMQSVNFKEGAIVNKGDLLFEIDPRPFEAELARNEGEVGRAKARLSLAQTEFKRTEKIVASAAASELELDEKKANLAEAEAALKIAQANLETARINLGYTRIKAEITGRISQALVKQGNLVTGGGQTQATLLTTITSLDPIYCWVDADERSVLKYQRLVREKKRQDIRGGQGVPALLALSDEKDFPHTGYIDFVDNRIDRNTGTLRARGIFPNPNGVMTPGLFGRLRVPGSESYRTWLVPELSVQSDQNSKYVLTVAADNTVHITPIKIGSQFGSLRAVESGLKGDERIIVNGLLKARPGGTVVPELKPMPGADEAILSTTRMVEPGTTRPSTQPTTAPSETLEDRAAKAAPAGGAREMLPIGVAAGVSR
jgi:RND family efflux transporter MFP subunit